MSEQGRIASKQFTLCLTEQEFQLLEKKAAKKYITKTAYIRSLIHNGVIIKIDPEFFNGFISALRPIGDCVNQIAYEVNSTKYLSQEQFAQLEAEYEHLFAVVEKYVVGV